MPIDFISVQDKWQKKWGESKLFQPQAGSLPADGSPSPGKFYLTAAYPYPNSPQHIGHARTYTTTDIYARFQRLQGKNVLFPMAFHVTGTPILAMAKRIEGRDKELFEIFDKIYGIPPATTSSLTDPRALVTHFSQEIEAGMKEMGYSIDWRRKFYTFDPLYNAFIQWQFRKLHEAGYIARGSHPVPWCPADNQAVGGHDTRGDVDPELEEVTAVLFPVSAGPSSAASGGSGPSAAEGPVFIPTITYRPETLSGVTNLWANPQAHYVLCALKGGSAGSPETPARRIYLSKEAFETLKHQFNLSLLRDAPASEILALDAHHPLTGRSLPILPASFVSPTVGTGLVMSVPAHAPKDWLALRDLNKLDALKPIPVLDTPGFGPCPAGELCERLGVKGQDDPKAEEATKTLYKLEAHEGKMKHAPYAGLNGNAAKDRIKADLSKQGHALAMTIMANAPVFCRCGASCVVKAVDNQWFINYGDEGWKARTREALAAMTIQPADLRREFGHTLEWLQKKACTRAAGLGTRFPFDEKQMIEALSDSTLYMSFYTVAHIAKAIAQEGGVESVGDAFFDYALLGKEPSGSGPGPKKTALWESARAEFLYWYPLDSRHSAHDLVRNHLTFFIFNHTAVFSHAQPAGAGKSRPAPSFWPRQTVSNGFVTMDGKKMSKSMGNILPLRKAIAQYGSDVIRFVVTSTAELEADSDFNQTAAEGVASRLNTLHDQLLKLMAQEPEYQIARDPVGDWFYSRLHRRLQSAVGQYERFELRPLAQALLYDTSNDLQAYLRQSPRPDLREFFELWTLLAAPFVPHLAEEFWAALGPKRHVPDAPFAAVARFPQADPARINPRLEMSHEYLAAVRADIGHILKLLKKDKPAAVRLIVHAPWKAQARALVAQHKLMPAVMAAAKADPELSARMPQVSALAAKFLKNVGAITGAVMSAPEEHEALEWGRALLASEFGCPVDVVAEADAPVELSAKAANALPGKPAIVIS